MKKTDWELPVRIERAYALRLNEGIQQLIEAALEKDTIEGAIQFLRDMSSRNAVKNWSETLATGMAKLIVRTNGRTWREAARKSMRGREVYTAMQREMQGPVGVCVREIIRSNAELIRSTSSVVAEEMAARAQRFYLEGKRAGAITSQLRALAPELAKSRVELIARTEVSKTSTALTQARSEEIGLDWYVWRSSEDSRVRQSHRFMDDKGGILIRWSDPPAPEALVGEKSTLGRYHAGACPNCRCYPEPLLRIDQVQWPHRVHLNGSVRRMTRAQFLQLQGAGVRMAAL